MTSRHKSISIKIDKRVWEALECSGKLGLPIDVSTVCSDALFEFLKAKRPELEKLKIEMQRMLENEVGYMLDFLREDDYGSLQDSFVEEIASAQEDFDILD